MLDLDKLQALTEAATPTPWRWAGNTDQEDPRIEGGPRRYYVMGVRRREREKGDRQTQDFERYMHEVEQFDPSLNDGKGGYRYLTEDEIAEAVRSDWLSEPNGEPRYDDRLSFINVDTKLMEYARDLAVYAVAPEATSRDDERVYRADIVGVRNPNAELMIAAVNALPELISEVRELRTQRDMASELAAHPLHIAETDAEGTAVRLANVDQLLAVAEAAKAWRNWFPHVDSMFAPENALIAAVDALDAPVDRPQISTETIKERTE